MSKEVSLTTEGVYAKDDYDLPLSYYHPDLEFKYTGDELSCA